MPYDVKILVNIGWGYNGFSSVRHQSIIEPMLMYWHLNSREQISEKFKQKYSHPHSRKCTSKYRLSVVLFTVQCVYKKISIPAGIIMTLVIFSTYQHCWVGAAQYKIMISSLVKAFMRKVVFVRYYYTIDMIFISPMHLSHIPRCTIQNRYMHISVLNDEMCDMKQVHCGICETVLLVHSPPIPETGEIIRSWQVTLSELLAVCEGKLRLIDGFPLLLANNAERWYCR